MDLLQCCVFQLKQCHQWIIKTRKHNFKLYCWTRARARTHRHTHTHTHTRARACARSLTHYSLTQSLTLTHACTHAYTHNQNWGRCRHYQHSISVNTLTLSATCNTYIRTFAVDTSTESPRSRLFVIRWCQLSAPDTITTSSPGNTLRVVFSSDWNVTYQGFSASYIVYDPYSGNSYVDWSVTYQGFSASCIAIKLTAHTRVNSNMD